MIIFNFITTIISCALFYFIIYPLKFLELCDYFILPFHLQKERLFILRSAKKIFKELGLKPIPIIYDNCTSCYHSPRENYIGIGIIFLEQNWDAVFDYVNGKFENRKGKLFFVVAHEIAHYLQHSKYPKWKYNALNNVSYLEFSKSNKISLKDYRLLGLEKNADRIALILSKKFGHAIDK